MIPTTVLLVFAVALVAFGLLVGLIMERGLRGSGSRRGVGGLQRQANKDACNDLIAGLRKQVAARQADLDEANSRLLRSQIALAKIWSGYRLGSEGWSAYDTEALQDALGHPVEAPTHATLTRGPCTDTAGDAVRVRPIEGLRAHIVIRLRDALLTLGIYGWNSDYPVVQELVRAICEWQRGTHDHFIERYLTANNADRGGGRNQNNEGDTVTV